MAEINFLTNFEMDQIIEIIFGLIISSAKTPDCVPVYFPVYEYTYEMPEGLKAETDWNKKGYFYFSDDYGNGGEIGYSNSDISVHANSNRNHGYDEKALDQEVIRFYKEVGPHDIGSWEVEILVPLGENTATIMIAREGDSEAYWAFEEKALQLARSVVQEEKDARYTGNCDDVGHPFWSLFSK